MDQDKNIDALIYEALTLIDEWIEELTDEELPEQCDRSGQSFFSYLTSRGVYSGWIANLVRDATGMHPRQISGLASAQTLRDVVRAYESTEAEARIRKPKTTKSLMDLIGEGWDEIFRK